MPINTKKSVMKSIRSLKYLNKDFDGFKTDLLEYARTYFPDKIKDFSEAGLGGLFLEMAAYVGDVQSFYLDHQFHETFPDRATETNNIERHLRNAGVPIVGASPAVVGCTILVKIPASGSNPPVPDPEAFPVIYQGSVARAQNGVEFELTDDMDFGKINPGGDLKATIQVGNRDANSNPTNFILSLKGTWISGKRTSETFTVSGFQSFKKVTLANENVTEIIRVVDDLGNEYHEVEYLTQDTVYKRTINNNSDSNLVEDTITPIPAPYRFIKETSLQNKLTTLTFGGATADSINDDIIPDPSEFAIPLYGKRTFSRFTINPENLLQTTTFGVISPNTTLTITYRYGGGLNHNVDSRSIRNMTRLDIAFPNNPLPSAASFVRNSVDILNEEQASGGDDSPTIDELKTKVPQFRAAQSRIVTKEDLLARVYTLPSNFGRVYRASIQPNPHNPLASQLFIICRDQNGQLAIASDTLKKNLAVYLNQYRMISDAIDILDAREINVKIQFSIVADPSLNKQLVLRNVLQRLKSYFSITNYNIDQPIILADIQNLIYNTDGVVSIVSIDVKNIFGTVGTSNPRVYSNEQFDVRANTVRGIIFGPPGSIFAVKFNSFDVAGNVS